MTVPLESLFPSEEPYPPSEPHEPHEPGPPGPPTSPEELFPGDATYPGEAPYPGEAAYPGETSPDQPPFRAEYPYRPAPAYDAGTSYDNSPYGPPAPYEPPGQFGGPEAYQTQPAYPYETQSPFGAPPRSGAEPAYQAGPGYQAQPAYPPQTRYQGAPDDGREPHVSIILPCFNQQDHVLAEVERISRAMDASGRPYELVAIDDASTDATLQRLRSAEPYLPRLRVVHFARTGGPGTVRRIGTQRAKGEIVVWTDAGLSYPNDRIPEFVAMLDNDPAVDQVVGARQTEAASRKITQAPARWFIRKLAEQLTNADVPDLNSGLRAFRRSVAQPYLRLLAPGSSGAATITLAFLSNEHGVRYVPVDCAQRPGQPKFRVLSGAYGYLVQVLRMVMYFNPLKILMPPALFLIGLGLLKGLYDLVVLPLRVANGTILIFVTGLIIASVALLADLTVRSRGDA